MINLIYLCFNAKAEEKKEIYEVLINSDAITNFCQESVKTNLCLELNYKLQGIDVFDNKKLFYEKLISKKNKINFDKKLYKNLTSKKNPNYINVIKIINKYFDN